MSRLFKRRPWPLLPPQARRRFIPSAAAGIAVSGAGAIASAEAFGTAQLNFTLLASGIASAEAFGTLGASFQVPLTGIPSGEAFGTAKLNFTLAPSGIASGEAFGTPSVVKTIAASGIVTAEAFGAPTVLPTYTITAAGIASSEAFGAAAVVQPLLPQTLLPGGIASAEAFGAAVVIAPLTPTQAVGIGQGDGPRRGIGRIHRDFPTNLALPGYYDDLPRTAKPVSRPSTTPAATTDEPFTEVATEAARLVEDAALAAGRAMAIAQKAQSAALARDQERVELERIRAARRAVILAVMMDDD